MSTFLQDLRFAARQLYRNRGVTVTAILSLTLGIGATTAVFSVVYALLVNPYPYLGADRIISLNVFNEKGDLRGVGRDCRRHRERHRRDRLRTALHAHDRHAPPPSDRIDPLSADPLW